MLVELFRSIQREREAFNKLCDSLPKEHADRLRQRRRERLEKEQEQRDRIEVARAGRSLNFWGNR